MSSSLIGTWICCACWGAWPCCGFCSSAIGSLLARLLEPVATAGGGAAGRLAHVAHLDRRGPAGDDALRLLGRRAQRLALLVPGHLVDRREQPLAALLLLDLDGHPDGVGGGVQ